MDARISQINPYDTLHSQNEKMNPNGFVKLPLKGEGIRMEQGYHLFLKKVYLCTNAWQGKIQWLTCTAWLILRCQQPFEPPLLLHVRCKYQLSEQSWSRLVLWKSFDLPVLWKGLRYCQGADGPHFVRTADPGEDTPQRKWTFSSSSLKNKISYCAVL